MLARFLKRAKNLRPRPFTISVRDFNFRHISENQNSLDYSRDVKKKCGKTITIRFGEPVMPEDMASMKGGKVLAAFLKQKVYDLEEKQEELIKNPIIRKDIFGEKRRYGSVGQQPVFRING